MFALFSGSIINLQTPHKWYSQPILLYLYNFDIVCLAIIPSYIVLQLVRSNSRRFMPSQADEEIHQLSYLQKHMANILTLLADSVEGEGDDSLVWHLFFSVVCFGREIHHVLFSDFHTRVSWHDKRLIETITLNSRLDNKRNGCIMHPRHWSL